MLLAACSPPAKDPTPPPQAAPSVEPVPQPVVTPASGSFSLAFPMACDLGQDCFIQQYVDHDPAKGAATDYTCGIATYDGHTGTDFRIPNRVAQARGVAVLAAAGGVVDWTHDGEIDWDTEVIPTLARDKQCGNGVTLRHPGGWSTWYCHLRKGSVRVRKGQTVTTGQPLGLVGQSGRAEFPHMHFMVVRDQKVVDPFATASACSAAAATSLWQVSQPDRMAYPGRQVTNAVFASGSLTMDAMEHGDIPPPTPSTPVLGAYVRAANLHAGDVQTLKLYGPDGKPLVTETKPALANNFAVYMAGVGIEHTDGKSWSRGTYRATYTVTAGAKTVLYKEFSQNLP